MTYSLHRPPTHEPDRIARAKNNTTVLTWFVTDQIEYRAVCTVVGEARAVDPIGIEYRRHVYSLRYIELRRRRQDAL